MSIDQGSRAIGGQLQVGAGVYPAVGVGEGEIYGAIAAEGPVVFGEPTTFSFAGATLSV